MSGDRPDRRSLAVRPGDQPYDVGYGKPPAETRFKPGQSGNPNGRPRGSKNRPALPALNEERLKQIVLEEAYRTIPINDPSGPMTIPMSQAVMRSLAVNAAKGHQRAQRLFTELLSATERDNKHLHDRYLEAAIDYKNAWDAELERRRRFGISAPDPIPHPDHIVIDTQTGTVRMNGPMTKEEKPVWDELRNRKRECDRELADLRAMLENTRDKRRREKVLGDIAFHERMRATIAQVIPD